MIAAWMVYCGAVALILGVSGAVTERVLRSHGRSGRWVWVATLVGSAVIPLLSLLGSRPDLVMSVGVGTGTLGAATDGLNAVLGPIVVGVREAGDGAVVSSSLALAWLGASLTVLGWAMGSYTRLVWGRRCWSRRCLDGTPVVVTPGLGPAVAGFLRGMILLPRWALELGADVRRLILLHERSHLDAGDQRLPVLALPLLIAMPWNLPLWWQFRRLRLAIEVDCDGRVLGTGVPKREYGRLLLEVSRRGSGTSIPVAALAEPKSLLERRLEIMLRRDQPRRGPRTAAAILGTALLVGLACEAPPPTVEERSPVAAERSDSRAPVADGTDASESELQWEPYFTPFTVAPEIRDRAGAVQSVERHYPELLRRAGIEGTVQIYVYIDDDGEVLNAQVKESSGDPRLDEAAVRAAREFEFTPALDGGEPTAVWILLPISFTTA